MKGRKNYLKSLESEEAALDAKRNALAKKREFYDDCQRFSGKEMESVLKYIVPMISKVEGVEFVDHTFSMREKDHYETFWRSPYEGQYGVSGAELAATAEPYESLVKGESFKTRVIVDKATCDTFQLLSFSNCEDYRRNLSRLLATKKFFEIKARVVTKTKRFEWKGIFLNADMFSDMFPYVSTFLERLTDWRLENGTEKIPEDVLIAIAETVTAETLSKTQKGPVKVAQKNNG